MFKRVFALMFIFVVSIFASQNYSWEIVLEIPDETPQDAQIFIAGNFNGWDPGNPDYQLNEIGEGLYGIKLEPEIDDLEFKFTLGSWKSVEVNERGRNISNRRAMLNDFVLLSTCRVKGWSKVQTGKNIVGNISVINNFEMPQLERTRSIWIYLPPSYGKGLKRFPVMYMHDGQNLFADSTSFSGEWGIDETLESLYADRRMKEIIVVGIENSEYRLSEYSPFDFEYKGVHTGQAKKYGEFIVKTLKPYIDKNYRTKRGRRQTAISGSSMGGLVSVYIALEHQDIFSKVGALSSSFDVCRDEFVTYIKNTPKRYPIRFWLDLGSVESEQMQYDVSQQMVIDALISSGWKPKKEVKYTLYEGAKHHERFWRDRFEEVLEYLWR